MEVAIAPMPKPRDDGTTVKNPPAGKGPSGKVMVKGQPLTAAEVTLVSLDQAKPRVFTTAIQADGTYAFADPLPPGKYVVIVTAKAVPEKYQLTTTSGLVLTVGPGPATFDLDLK